MVFKVIAGVPGRVAKYWKLPYTTSEYTLEALNKMNTYKKFYKNRIIQNWDMFTPKEVRQKLNSSDRKLAHFTCLSKRMETMGSYILHE